MNMNFPMIKHFTAEWEMFVVLGKIIAMFLNSIEYIFSTHVQKLFLLFMGFYVDIDLKA